MFRQLRPETNGAKEEAMRTTTAFNECADAVKTQVRAYWTAKQRQLEELLRVIASDENQLDLTVYHQPQSSRYDVQAVLTVRAATLTAEAVDRDVAIALDRVFALLTQAVQEHNGGAARRLRRESDSVDGTSEDSFPASDAPSWTPVTAAGPPPAPDL
jgi:ribosome-associated translation inhibitor RaiA